MNVYKRQEDDHMWTAPRLPVSDTSKAMLLFAGSPFAGHVAKKVLCATFLFIHLTCATLKPHQNVALGKPVRQKTVYLDLGIPMGPEFAVDGDPNRLCSQTQGNQSNWWIVDLMHDYEIQAVRITTTDIFGTTLHEFAVYVSSKNPLNTETNILSSAGKMCAYRREPIPAGVTETINCSKPLIGRYVTVFTETFQFLRLCEVEVIPASSFKFTQFAAFPGKFRAKTPFHRTMGATNALRCCRICLQAPGGWATATQYRSTDGNCECIEISGFDYPALATVSSPAWQMYVATSN